MASGTAKLAIDDALFTLLAHVGLGKAREKLPAMLQKIPVTVIKIATHPHGIEIRGLGFIKPVFQPSISPDGLIDLRLQVNTLDLSALGDLLRNLINDQVDELRKLVEDQGLHFHLREVQTRQNELVITATVTD